MLFFHPLLPRAPAADDHFVSEYLGPNFWLWLRMPWWRRHIFYMCRRSVCDLQGWNQLNIEMTDVDS